MEVKGMRKWLLAIGMVLGLSALAQGGKLEIFSWWAGDEGPALEALIRLYKQKYPGVEVINATVTGGAGVNARAVLKTRMLGGDPPDTFQVHAGMDARDLEREGRGYGAAAQFLREQGRCFGRALRKEQEPREFRARSAEARPLGDRPAVAVLGTLQVAAGEQAAGDLEMRGGRTLAQRAAGPVRGGTPGRRRVSRAAACAAAGGRIPNFAGGLRIGTHLVAWSRTTGGPASAIFNAATDFVGWPLRSHAFGFEPPPPTHRTPPTGHCRISLRCGNDRWNGHPRRQF